MYLKLKLMRFEQFINGFVGRNNILFSKEFVYPSRLNKFRYMDDEKKFELGFLDNLKPIHMIKTSTKGVQPRSIFNCVVFEELNCVKKILQAAQEELASVKPLR